MRESKVERKTLETEISIKLNLDGTGSKKINTGIKFFDHMLDQLSSHGYFDLEIEVKSHDNDPHHIVEDTSLALGEAFKKALGDKKGINRYGYTTIPMDEALTLCSIDLSGRPYCNFDAKMTEERVRDFETILTNHFFQSFSVGSLSTLHISLLYGEDTHHIIESIFKAFARALNTACSINKEHAESIPSTKGTI
ncbi:MAG: imidazoleglycerol-phosphate dehydratase [Candidatus Melainabacteria bacterium RIFOXYA12_FULL_32_12]|nr:MAG: imidazoleglycerol-phosphate dehydratase [Candidatus Melainabacteria bacterium RIFOXYA2_FULL_32_9]OGI28233.1 MAG: imidazoleglycerol-phosphate dehydratase [Candidatus Melainabacteria bacterium RIFOXYA12_FULL_32_12]